ncbi:MAG: galactokinase family protein [Acidipropionibacterium acidipropionici]|uniref:GHMP kinase, N-terminal domain-containing protein n=1 Tax=Acidipropionibacterium acidipropionici (strain ATCC 4875 / DSM 20272 / JCM 6432 / NBRC 12425 / NCIMB 8070 / 4) TaxID=1171373 RepID=K7S768_ACIA4|nr:galactokinase family protein [Acidipropionibacterium acidipropionici]AFV90432.1 GHMP kinase, N-terminal domain-containing protein [Acidipropionibacterium acidipropionici ATCC 4875]QCV94348.1 galactokinase [Acidipropionibacterium acidipropionici]
MSPDSPLTGSTGSGAHWFVPGRIEVLGKHTDYAGGRTLVAAVDRGVTTTCSPWDGEGVTASSTAVPGELHLTAGVDPHLAAGHWGGYVQAVIDRLTDNFGPLAPCRIEVSSDLPLASGMSSSSALVSSVVLALADANGFTGSARWARNVTDEADLAQYLACFENGMSFKELPGAAGVGTFGGSEDHTAMVASRAGQLGQFRFCPIRLERRVAFPADLALVVAVSGVAAEKTGAARDLYNRASLATREILRVWNEATGRRDAVLADALDADPGALRLHRLVSGDDYLTRRLDHFLAESERIIPAAADALEAGDLDGFGAAVDESQEVADTLLGNQVPQTIALARIARRLGAVAACSFGAGFGGSVWAGVPRADAEAFAAAWSEGYRAEFPAEAARATTLITAPGPSARRLG